MVEQEDASRFTDWIRSEGLPIMCGDAEVRPRLTRLVEVPGDPEFSKQACSFALQLEFPTREALDEWADAKLPKGLGLFRRRFGTQRALFFASILEEIKL